MVQAVRMALHVGEDRLGVTDIFGEDVGAPLGGVFTATQGLKTTWNSPLDERGLIGTAIGLALAGQVPVAEIQFCDYAFNTIDLLKLAGGMAWSSGGDWNCPLVVMTPVGSGIHGSIYHSHSFDAQATRLAGWKIVMPSTPRDAYGLMLSAIVDPNPVMVLIPKALMRVKHVPGEEIPFGVARTVRAGEHVTVVCYGRMVRECTAAAESLAAEGISVEVIDLRSLHPYDWPTLSASIRKTGRVLFVNEDTEITNFGEHLIRRTVDELFYELHAPPKLLAGAHLPGIGLADNLEKASVPQRDGIIDALRALARHEP
jgi:2-oxoisovalerate dehydrogenase E1 component beta subunit